MEIEKMVLSLNQLEVDCVIGERPDERERLQRLLIDAELEISPAAAGSDDLADTADYAELSEKITARLKEAKCMMIERAAHIAAAACLEDKAAETNYQKFSIKRKFHDILTSIPSFAISSKNPG